MASEPLPPNSNPSFAPDYPLAIVYPAHQTNYRTPAGHGGVPNRPRGCVLHTPEEPADNVESTPAFFAQPNREASTTYYLDNDGDVYQLVPESCMAIANGVEGKPYPSWADPSTSLNWQSFSIEIEGRAATIHETLTPAQWASLIALIRHRCGHYGIPLDREHIIGHYQVSNQRSDPGAGFPWDALMRDLQEGDGLNEQQRDELLNLRGRTLLEWATLNDYHVYEVGDAMEVRALDGSFVATLPVLSRPSYWDTLPEVR
jgi:N-acetyl-anhydromuramyl-L-alanine amidase AmpD